MNLRPLALSLALYGAAQLTARAQAGVYGTVSASTISSLPYTVARASDGSPVNAASTGSFSPLGFTAGAFYDFHTFGPVRLGADLRVSRESSRQGANPNTIGAGGRIYSFLGGVRGSFRTPIAPLKPYAQLSIGLARSNFGNGSYDNNILKSGLTYQGIAGVDIRLLPVLDFRAIEVGYGAINGFGSGAPSGTFPIRSVRSGLVVHLPF